MAIMGSKLIDLSHAIESGMTTYKGLPGPHICDYWSRKASAANYDDGSTFQIGRIDMVANTGTYLDTPFHRFEAGDDPPGVPLERLAGSGGARAPRDGPATPPPGLPRGGPRGRGGPCPRRGGPERARELLGGPPPPGRGVLPPPGGPRHWRTEAYQEGHPFLTEAAARLFVERGAAL